MVEVNVYLVQMICICNQKPRKYASEIDNNVLLYVKILYIVVEINVYVVQIYVIKNHENTQAK